MSLLAQLMPSLEQTLSRKGCCISLDNVIDVVQLLHMHGKLFSTLAGWDQSVLNCHLPDLHVRFSAHFRAGQMTPV